MRACIQRVRRASVSVADEVVGNIDAGLLVLLGVTHGDTDHDAEYLARKTALLRVFEDDDGVMNRSVRDLDFEVLVVSQFTLYGDCRKGNRPSYTSAADPAKAEQLYEAFLQHLGQMGVHTARGRFRAEMEVTLVNDGPVTILLESQKSF